MSSSFCSSSTPQDIKACFKLHLNSRLSPVLYIERDLARFTQRESFREYILARYNLASLSAQGEESSIRRIVHAYLSVNDAEYQELLQQMRQMRDPWAIKGKNNGNSSGSTTGEDELFLPIASKLTTSSQKNSHLNVALAGLQATNKVLAQLSTSLEKPRQKYEEEGDEEAKLILTERQGRVAAMEEKRRRFEALIAILTRTEQKLREKHAEILRLASSSMRKGGGSSPRNSHALGKEVEKEGQTALEGIIQKVNEEMEAAATLQTSGSPLRLLTGVLIKSLDTPELTAVRRRITEEENPVLYAGVGSPKAEIDALIVCPRLDNEKILQGKVASPPKHVYFVLLHFKFCMLLDM